MTDITIDTRKMQRDLDRIAATVSKDIQKNMRKEMNKAVKIIVTAQRAAIRSANVRGVSKGDEPMTYKGSGNNLRASIARSLRIVNRNSRDGYQIKVRSEPGKMPAGMRKLPEYAERGRWAHPIMGKSWAKQTVTPGWFSRPSAEKSPQVYAQLEQILRNY